MSTINTTLLINKASSRSLCVLVGEKKVLIKFVRVRVLRGIQLEQLWDLACRFIYSSLYEG